MRVRYIFITIAVIIFMSHFAAGGLIGSQFQGADTIIDVEQVISSSGTNNGLDVDDQLIQDKSISSKATLISLLVAVMGVVAFRRNN